MKVESFEIDGWQDVQTGLVVAENTEWVLVKHIPVDYVIDGYRLYKKQYIIKRFTGEAERQIERVLRLKGEKDNLPSNFEFTDTVRFLRWLQEQYGLFEFQDDDETELFYGRINKVFDSILIIDSIHSDGTIEEEFDCDFNINEIRSITFLSDYYNSICLLWLDEQQLTRLTP